jgi:hypothetical protein
MPMDRMSMHTIQGDNACNKKLYKSQENLNLLNLKILGKQCT